MNFIKPATIIDCGANIGNWSLCFDERYPEHHGTIRYIMIEAYPHQLPRLVQVARQLEDCKVIIALLGADAKPSVPFHVVLTENYPGSSVYPENTTFPRMTLELEQRTLDEVLEGEPLATPILLKLDTQGAELDILKGCPKLLSTPDLMLQMELSLVEYNKGAPLLHEVVAWLAERGFLMYDMNPAHKKDDGNLYQIDAVFVRKDYPMRTNSCFWEVEPKI